jgi:hypothetical protein
MAMDRYQVSRIYIFVYWSSGHVFQYTLPQHSLKQALQTASITTTQVSLSTRHYLVQVLAAIDKFKTNHK